MHKGAAASLLMSTDHQRESEVPSLYFMAWGMPPPLASGSKQISAWTMQASAARAAAQRKITRGAPLWISGNMYLLRAVSQRVIRNRKRQMTIPANSPIVTPVKILFSVCFLFFMANPSCLFSFAFTNILLFFLRLFKA